MALEAVPMASTVENLEKFLFSQFPSRATFTTKDYEKDGNQTTPEAIEMRFKKYHKICLYGIGSIFMGAATGVLDNMQKKHPNWVRWGSFYFAASLVVILAGTFGGG